MYFLFFKLHSWGKRFGSCRRRFIQRFHRQFRVDSGMLWYPNDKRSERI